MAIRYEVLSAPSLRDRLQVLSKRLFEVDATPRNLPRLVADAAKYINDAGFLFDGSSDGRDRWPAGWEYLWPFNLNDRWLLQWGELSKDVDYARDELESSTVEVDRDTVLAWLQAAFASHLQRWLSQCVPGMSLNPGSAFVPIEWRGKFALRKYHWKHQRNLAASAVLIGPSEYQQFADDVATVCAYLAEQLTVWLAVTESPAPIAPASPSLAVPKSEGTPVDDGGASSHSVRGGLPRDIVDVLKNQQFKVIDYLWRQPRSVPITSLRQACWSNDVGIETVRKTVRRAEKTLVEANIFHVRVEWSETKDAVRLIVDDLSACRTPVGTRCP